MKFHGNIIRFCLLCWHSFVPLSLPFKKMSLCFSEIFAEKAIGPKVTTYFHCFTSFWKEPLQATRDALVQCVQDLLMLGDVECASLASFSHCQQSLFCGKDLATVDMECRSVTAKMVIFLLWSPLKVWCNISWPFSSSMLYRQNFTRSNPVYLTPVITSQFSHWGVKQSREIHLLRSAVPSMGRLRMRMTFSSMQSQQGMSLLSNPFFLIGYPSPIGSSGMMRLHSWQHSTRAGCWYHSLIPIISFTRDWQLSVLQEGVQMNRYGLQ